MLDDLRDSATESYLDDEGEEFYDADDLDEIIDGDKGGKGGRKPFLGLTPFQRFIIVLILFLITCVLGAFCLVLTGRMWLPFF
jgi:hypothetical protein